MALAEFIVMFREVFEIALVLGIMLAYLYKTKNRKFVPLIYLGAGLAVAASVLAVAAFGSLAAEWFEKNEELFEGITLVAASCLVTWLVLWMLSQRNMARNLERGIAVRIGQGEELGLVLFSFVAVFRESLEIALFLGGILLSTGALNFAMSLAGGAAALALACGVFMQFLRLDMRGFFLATSAMLVLLAAGLLSQGVHELQEAGVVPTSIEHVYDITPQQSADGTYPLMHERGAVGALLKGLVGYDTAPSLEQAIAYVGYLAAVCLAYLRIPSKGRL